LQASMAAIESMMALSSLVLVLVNILHLIEWRLFIIQQGACQSRKSAIMTAKTSNSTNGIW